MSDNTSADAKDIRDDHHHYHHINMYHERTCHFPGFGSKGLISYDWLVRLSENNID